MDRPGGAVERIQREVWRGLPWPQLRAKHREALIKLEGLAYSLLHRPPPSLRLRCAALFTHVCSVCTTTVARCGSARQSGGRTTCVLRPHRVLPAHCCSSG